MEFKNLKSSAYSLDEAYKNIVKLIEGEEKEQGLNQYYKIEHIIAFSKDDKERIMYCFETGGRNSNIKEF